LISTFPLRRQELAKELQEQLATGFQLSQGPLLQASAPYAAGASVRELVEEGVLHETFLRMPPEAFPIDRPLYLHQEQAIRKAVGERRNLMVATGTGSGKTECFLLPIIDRLFREQENGTLHQPGVRALLLYPMNALANDQLKRLRELLAPFPEITFGRYVGETKNDPDDAEADFRSRYPSEPRLHNELISRQVMQERPPQFLLTNYAMLEYLLLRPDDSALFDGSTGDHWQFLALDEIHVYTGASGSEIAMLLRRLRDRINGSERGRLQCFGTSATLGKGVDDYPDLVKFAEELFDEPFEWGTNDDHQDVVEATRLPLTDKSWSRRLDDDQILLLQEKVKTGATAQEIATAAGIKGADSANDDTAAILAEILADDKRVTELLQALEAGSVDLQETADALFGGSGSAEKLVALVDLCRRARDGESGAPLIPARYHFFVRALEGAFLCQHPEHDPREPALVLSRHEYCPSCARAGREAVMFEIGVCRRCGSEYLVGSIEPSSDDGRVLRHANAFAEQPVRALLGEALSDDQDDEDQDLAQTSSDKAVPAKVCPGCGELSEAGDPQCRCEPRPSPLAVWLATDPKETGALRRCIACAYRNPRDPVYRFLTGSDAPVSVLATNLYQELPASEDDAVRREIGQGRKLLTFSDSRQDAAFFAPFLERTYRLAIERRLIAQSIEELRGKEPRTADLIEPVRREAEDALVLDEDDGRLANQTEVSTWLTRELLALDRRQSLEGTGVAEIKLATPRGFEAPEALLDLGFSEDEATTLLHLLLDTLRRSGAVSVLEGVDIRDEVFAPRNKEIFVREQAAEPGVLAWLPAKSLNGRLDLLERIFERREIEADAKEVLAGIWRYLTQPDGVWAKTLQSTHSEVGPMWRIAAERYVFQPGIPERAPLRCSRCQQLWWSTVSSICPAYRCTGELEAIDNVKPLADDHYARLYRGLKPVGMAVEEHTAQWTSAKASAIQDEFIQGRVNVLSCSTTFELGVDVGDIEAVLLRNVPPGPANYVQRAGRAGRRTDAAALVVTFAQRRSHDLHYFERPRAMVDGIIPPPQIVLDNMPIARRHLHSVAFSAFQRDLGESKSVEEFFLDTTVAGETRHDQFMTWLKTKPEGIGDAAKRVVPQGLHGSLGLDSWDWVTALEQSSETEPTHGWLARANSEVVEDAEALDELVSDAAAAEQFKKAQAIKTVRNALVRRQLLSFLASRNVLPKYGFPVDVVDLQVGRSGERAAANLELARDMKLAIADYAPGTDTVAAKQLWRSIGLVRRQDRQWPTYAWATCEACGSFAADLETDPVNCLACGSEALKQEGRFVIPIYGFAGKRVAAAGETRPARLARMKTHFGSYRDDPPEFESAPGLHDVEMRSSRQGRITVVNEGPMGAGFRVCEWCGWAEPVTNAKAKKSHQRPDRPGQECRGELKHLSLGHEYLTDVLELRMGRPATPEAARSALYAMLEAAPNLGVDRGDIDGTLSRPGGGAPHFVIFDSVPGGAGHTQKIASNLDELVEAARDRVSSCECGLETSCYGCLRNYSNQVFHDDLSRGDALAVLETFLEP
jgi:ATP-dependent helicase YprA (DUF1998 family)